MGEVSVQLIHGDCIEQMQTLPDACVDMILTDLPYGTTQNKWDSVILLSDLWAAWRRVCKPGAPIILFTQQPFTTTVAASNLKQLRTEWIWEKPQGTGFLNSKRYPLKNHENVLVFCDRLPRYYPQMRIGFQPYRCVQGGTSPNYGKQPTNAITESDGTRYPLSVINFARDKDKYHPTQKPVALCEYLIRTYTNEGDTVLDCTMGSGTTGVAAMNTGRSFIGIERDETYFSVAQERIPTTGESPSY